MLSRVLKDVGAEVKPLLPRHAAAPPKLPDTPQPQGAPPAPDESARLRAKLAELTAHAEQQARQVYDSGRRAGEAAVHQQVDEELRRTADRMAATISEIAQARADTIRRAEADTVRLAVEIARRILHREISTDTSALEALIKAAMEKLQGQEVYRVRVHPDQENLVKACLLQAGRGESVAVIADPVQPTGGAVFEISRGALDASVETQLREIERGLTDQLEKRI